jgi:hypothetical protein
MSGLRTPLSTLRIDPRGPLRMTRGRCGSLNLHRKGLAPSTSCRSPGAPVHTITLRPRFIQVAGFLLECMAGFVGIRSYGWYLSRNWVYCVPLALNFHVQNVGNDCRINA